MKAIFLVSILAFCSALYAQESTKGSSLMTLKPIAQVELWGTMSSNLKNNESTATNQYNIFFRRLRFGAKGSVNERINYHFLLHADHLGENEYAATNGTYKGIGLWRAMVDIRLSPSSSLLNLHAGYYNIAVSRESHTSYKTLGSVDKNIPDWYLRHFLTGRGSGIESSASLAGSKDFTRMSFTYRAGVMMPEIYLGATNNSLLYTLRCALKFGDVAGQKYKYYESNAFKPNNKRLELGVGMAYQENGLVNDTLIFQGSNAYGGDFLMQYHHFMTDGAGYLFGRKVGDDFSYSGRIWYLRSRYNFNLWNQHLEIAVCYQNYEGTGDKLAYKFIGTHSTLDTGINLYLNGENAKVTVHYISQIGSSGLSKGDHLACTLLVSIM